MMVLHVNWSAGALRLWAESRRQFLESAPSPGGEASPAGGAAAPGSGGAALATLSRTAVAVEEGAPVHPFAAPVEALRSALIEHGLHPDVLAEPATISLVLPSDERGPRPSDRLAASLAAVEESDGHAAWLSTFTVPALTLAPARAIEAMLRLQDRGPAAELDFGHSVRYWEDVCRFVLELLVDQRFIPTLVQEQGNRLRGAWQPWLGDDVIAGRAVSLLQAMPPVGRAVVDEHRGAAATILESALTTLADAAVRRVLVEESFDESTSGRDADVDPHVAWLNGLLGQASRVSAPPDIWSDLVRDVRQWMARLEDAGRHRTLRLGFKLDEPLRDAADGSEAPLWPLHFRLVGPDSRPVIEASQVWSNPASIQAVPGKRVADPQGLLLTELGRASRLYPALESAMAGTHPTHLELSTQQAYEFLSEYRLLLEESGYSVVVPGWWSEPSSRLGARLRIDADAAESVITPSPGMTSRLGSLGLQSKVRYHWQLAVGDQPLSLEEFERMAAQRMPLVRVGGRWVEVRPEDIDRAAAFLRERPGGEITVMEAVRLAYGYDTPSGGAGLPVLGLDASGWVKQLLEASAGNQQMEHLEQPAGFIGSLRPYQKSGISWLAFLDRFGLGSCLADDMGLGKTIQLIALLLWERETASAEGETPKRPNAETPKAEEEPSKRRSAEPSNDSAGAGAPDVGVPAFGRLGVSPGPTLLVVPTSVVSNWARELQRFAPTLKFHVQHGIDRPVARKFAQAALANDVVITTYALVTRDIDSLLSVPWHRVVLDEAQYIKNPPTKQATAIRALRAPRRIALTGTPVENRLSELWSIMEFCNPGYLGQAGEFRRHMAVPIERHRDRSKAEKLRSLVRPFILRRLKSDPTVISDLPQCLETREYATLTTEQARLYQQIVDSMLARVQQAEGIQRRGLVLAALVRLKQVCNHPALLRKPGEIDSAEAETPAGESEVKGKNGVQPSPSAISSSLAAPSGKCQRLLSMLEELLAAGDRAIIFTQFRQMGHLLSAMISQSLDCEPLFMHGGTLPAKRQEMIDRFQDASGRCPVFILSLKAGGVGLNLTAANHVFHFDRWWNPAVESQATDRAYRIGQTRTVHVHKFVCMGTLEERIDEMLQQKSDLADNIIGAGEAWLTELSTGQLRDLLTLRYTATELDA